MGIDLPPPEQGAAKIDGDLIVPGGQPSATAASLSGPSGESPGTRIGRYKLLELIGEGGFGSVFRAEQTFPIKRRVALKIIKLGMDTKQVIARFEAERQALAMMDHPNIAKVFDTGATDAGRPYFVMELVEGVCITRYCDEQKLTIKQRLELFVQVCQAVQHAHTKGIIHRDIKPSNVLVSVADGVAVPKVIDFGIAKATQGRLTDQTLTTEQGRWMGTPQYMSPEQASGSPDIDTRSDIYMLGVLLYELLTGTTPFDADTLAAMPVSEIQRIICEVDPPRPSVRLSALGDTTIALAAQRRFDPRKLSQLLEKELDWVVMRCLEKDRAGRYQTASALARDVQRYLANEPVTARPAGRTYRVRKFVRRNRVVVLASAAVLLALLLGLVGTLLYAHQTNLARLVAEGAKRAAEIEGAERLISEGDALGAASRWPEARDRYTLARQRLLELGQPTLAADLGLWDAVRAIPVLNSFYPNVGEIECAEVFPDGRTAATGGKDGRLIIWDLAIAREILIVPAHQGPVHALAISPDGATVVTGGEDGKAKVWNVSDREQRQVFTIHGKPVRAVAVLPDGNRAASGGDDGVLRIWNLKTAEQIKSFSAPDRMFIIGNAGSVAVSDKAAPAPILSLAVSRGGRLIVAGSKDSYARVYDLEKVKLLRELGYSLGGSPVSCVAFSADDNFVLTGWGGDLVWWDRQTGTERTPATGLINNATAAPPRALHGQETMYFVGHNDVGHTNTINSLELSGDGDLVLTGADDMTARVWSSGGESREVLSDQSGRIAAARFAPTGNLVLTAGAAMRLWDISPGTLLQIVGQNPFPIDVIAISGDGRLVLTGSQDGAVRVFDAGTGRLFRRLVGHSEPITAIVLSPDGGQALSGSADGTLRVWDVVNGWLVRTIAAHRGGVAGVGVTADWVTAVSAGADGFVRLWDIRTGTKACTLGRHSAAPTSAAIAPDGSCAITGDAQGIVTVWGLKARRQISATMSRPGIRISAVAFSPKGKQFIVGYADGVCELSDTEGHQRLRLPSHTGEVRAIAFFADGMSAASVATDATIRISDLATGRELHRFYTVGTVVAVSADARFVVSGSHQIELHDLSRPALWRDFAPRLRAAQATLQRSPHDATALAEFGRWYALNHIDRWAIELLCAARAGGADISALQLAHCYLRDNDPVRAREEYRRALARDEAPRTYLELCLAALAGTRSQIMEWLKQTRPHLQAPISEREWEELYECYGPTWTRESPFSNSTPSATPESAAATEGRSWLCTPAVGFEPPGLPFKQLCRDGVLTGFEVTQAESAGLWGVSSIRPILEVNGRRVVGDVYGNPAERKATLEAKRGYAVAGVVAQARFTVVGFRLIFMRYSDGTLDPSDSYWSDWIGGVARGVTERLGCDGEPVIGVYGRSAGVLRTFGLIQPDRGIQRHSPKRIRDAIRKQIQLTASALAASASDANLLFERASLRAWLGQFDRAASDCDRAAALWQDDSSLYLPETLSAVVHLLAGDPGLYLRASDHALHRYAEGLDWQLLPVLRTYLLAQRPQSDSILVGRMVRALEKKGSSAPAFLWFMAFPYGLAEYRQQHLAPAEQWFARTSETAPGGPIKLAADLFRAMALERLDRHQEALRLFQQARDVLQPSDPDTLLRHYPRDLLEWLTALAAFKEAESTIPAPDAN